MPVTVPGLRGFSLGFKVPCYVHFKEKVLTAKNTCLGRGQVCVLAQVKPMVCAYQSSPRVFCFP